MSKDAKKISANRWLSLLWASGSAIYGWLLAGVIYGRDYPNLTLEKLGWADWVMALLAGLGVGGVSYGIFSLSSESKKAEQENQAGALFPIIVALLPALFFVSALATLVLTLATYSGDWKEARQGLATALAALIAAVGVVVSVAVSYKSGEENRLAQEKNLVTQLESQKDNLNTQLEAQQKHLEKQLKAQQDNIKIQLEHQREIEDEKGRREERKQDAELIKTLNDRLHEIIPRRYGGKPSEVPVSYFQLVALYRDWETLAASSQLVEGQKESQQRNILKILFGVYQEDETEPKPPVADTEVSESTSEQSQQKTSGGKSRSQVDIFTLNSVIQDIFPAVKEKKDGEPNESPGGEGDSRVFDLSYLDLRGLDFSKRHLNRSNLQGAHLEGAHLGDASLEGTNLRDAHLEGTKLWDAHLEGAILLGAHLEGAILLGAHLEGAILSGASLEESYFFYPWDDTNDAESRKRVIDQLKISRALPFAEDLLQAEGFDQELVDEIMQAYIKYWAEKRKPQPSEDWS